MTDPRPLKRDPNLRRNAETRFCATHGLVPALKALPRAPERPMIGFGAGIWGIPAY